MSYIKDNPFLQVIEYIGNETVYKPRPHGNAKNHMDSEYWRTAPSVMNEINNKLTSGSSVSSTYTSLVKECNEPKSQGVLNPRNREQVRNAQKQILAKQQISRDDIYNLYALALEIDDFIWQIDIFPNLDSVIGLKNIMDLFNDLLTLQSNEFQIVLAYDTTFQLGDFYVSPILFRHIYFCGSPIIPLAFLIHDRKFQVSHEKLFSKLTEKIPNLKKTKVPIIIDREKGICNATKLVPNLSPILCWNHIHQDSF